MKLIILLILTLTTYAEYIFQHRLGEYIRFKFIEIDKVAVSVNCKKRKTCDALNKWKKIKVKKRKWPAGGINPATFFCEQSGGRARTFYYKNKDEVSICEYSDKSYLKTWTAIKQFSKR